MAIIANDGGDNRNFEITPAGMHIARCYMVCDLGIQEKTWEGKTKHLHKIRIAFELPDTLMQEGDNQGRPFSISQEFTLTLSDQGNLRPFLESWRGKAFTEGELKGFDVTAVLGAPCMINVVHKSSNDGKKTFANIGAITPTIPGQEVPPAINQPINFSLADYTPEQAASLPDWLKKRINFEIPNYHVLREIEKQNERDFLAQAGQMAQGQNPSALNGPSAGSPSELSYEDQKDMDQTFFDDSIPF